MDQAPDETTLPPSLRLLKGLVILLTLTMIGAVITVVALLVTRMPSAIGSTTPAPLPAQITLPDGSKPSAFTQGSSWFAVVTTNDHILIYNHDGTLRQDIAVVAAP